MRGWPVHGTPSIVARRHLPLPEGQAALGLPRAIYLCQWRPRRFRLLLCKRPRATLKKGRGAPRWVHGGEASGIKEIAHSAVGVLQQNGPGWCWGGTACCRACARYTSVCTAHAYGMIVRSIGGAWVGRHVGLDGTLGGRMPSLHHRFQSFMLANPRDCATARAPAGTRAVGSGG